MDTREINHISFHGVGTGRLGPGSEGDFCYCMYAFLFLLRLHHLKVLALEKISSKR